MQFHDHSAVWRAMESDDRPRLLEIVREHSRLAREVSDNLMTYGHMKEIRSALSKISSLRV